LTDYFEGTFLCSWREFISTLRKSDPFNRVWREITLAQFGKTVLLQKDCPTRWWSTISMLAKAVKVKDCVLLMVAKAPEKQRVSLLVLFF